MSIIFDAVTGRLSLDTKQFQQTIEGAGNRFSKVLSGMASVATKVAVGIGASLAGATGAVLAMVKSAQSLGDELLHLANRTGISVEQLSILKRVAELGNTTFEDLVNGINRMQKAVTDAKLGNERLAKTFDMLFGNDEWRSIEDVNTLFLRLIDTLKNTSDITLRTALTMDIFGRSGFNLASIIADGSVAIEEISRDVIRFGLVTTEQAKAADVFGDRLAALWANLKGIGINVGNVLIPQINKALEAALLSLRFLADNWQVILVAIVNATQIFGDNVAAIFNTLAINLTQFALWVANNWKDLLLDAFKGAWNAAAVLLEKLNEKLGFDLVTLVQEPLSGAMDKLPEMMRPKLQAIGDAFTVLSEPIAKLVNDVANLGKEAENAGDKAVAAMEKAGEAAENLVQNVGGAGGFGLAAIGPLLAGVQTALANMAQPAKQTSTAFQQMARGILANINPIPNALRTIGDVFRSVFTGIQSFGTQVFTQFAQSWGQFFQVIDQLDAKAQSLLQADMLRAQLQLLQINLAALQASSAANPQSIADLQAQIAAIEAQIRAAGSSAGAAQSISAPLNVNIQTSGGEVAGMRVVQQVERQLKRRGVDLTRSRSLRLTTA